MISGNSASTILIYFLCMYCLKGKINDVWQPTTYTDAHSVSSQESAHHHFVKIPGGRLIKHWSPKDAMKGREMIGMNIHTGSTMNSPHCLCWKTIKLTFSMFIWFSCNQTSYLRKLTVLHVYRMVGSIHVDNNYPLGNLWEPNKIFWTCSKFKPKPS